MAPTYDQMSVSASGYRINYLDGRIFSSRSDCDSFVRVCSSGSFYKAQIEWSILTVAQYHWRFIRSECLGNPYPDTVPAVVRFCLSWIIGHDCTDCKRWPADKFHAWLLEKLGRFEYSRGRPDLTRASVVKSLKDVASVRMSAYSSLFKLKPAPPCPVYYGRCRAPSSCTDKEADVVRQLALLRFVREERPYVSVDALLPVLR